jgi:Fe-S-cluster containining protein
MITPTRPAREDLKPGEVLCQYCTAKCCRYFALPIETPESFEDFEYLRWYMLHGRATIFTEDDTWYLLVYNECDHLQSDNRCGIYDTRPQICRDYSTDKCEYDDDWTYDRYFETSAQMVEFTEAMFAEPGQPGFRSPRPPLLPVLGQV